MYLVPSRAVKVFLLLFPAEESSSCHREGCIGRASPSRERGGGEAVRGTRVGLQVVAMGWSWALHLAQLVHAAVTSPRVPLRRTWCPEAGVHAQYKPATTILGDFSIIVRASTFFKEVNWHAEKKRGQDEVEQRQVPSGGHSSQRSRESQGTHGSALALRRWRQVVGLPKLQRHLIGILVRAPHDVFAKLLEPDRSLQPQAQHLRHERGRQARKR